MISAVCFFAARQRNTVTVALLFSVLKPLQKKIATIRGTACNPLVDDVALC